MKFIPLKNQRLKKLLSNIIDILYTPKYKEIIKNTKDRRDDLQPDVYGCSDEYLKNAFNLNIKDYGFPRSVLGAGMQNIHANSNTIKITEPIQKNVNRIGSYLGAPVNALVMAYPDNGYIGWHHNGNASGFNILMTYSQDGDGWFKYWDREKQEIITMPDEPGWTCKVGYYPNDRNEKNKVYWHCAQTKKQRISIAYVLNHRVMWENMIDSITDGEFDKSVLNQYQMTH